MKIFHDQLNRKIQLKGTPEKIVSLVPSQTELLVDLGLRDSIVGITKFCVHPKELRKEKTIVGGTKQVHIDRIKALEPDIILCNKEENTEEMVVALEQVAPVHVSEVMSIDDSLRLTKQYGEMLAVTAEASEIVRKTELLRIRFQREMEQVQYRKVAYFIWKDPWMVAGRDTFIGHLLQLNKFENVFAGEVSKYPEISLGQLGQKKVDFVFLSTEPFPFKEKHINLLDTEVSKDRVHIVDGEYFSWYGSRLLAAFNYFRELHALIS